MRWIFEDWFGGSMRPESDIAVALYKATFDESGDSKKHHFYAMAGILATRRQFKALYKAWRLELHKHPRIESFHMTDAASREGEFEGWSVPRVNAKVEALTDVLRGAGSAYTIVLIPMWQFNRIMRISTADSGFPSHYYDPYLYCFVESVKSVWLGMTRPELFKGSKCDLLIFDRGRSNDMKRTCRAVMDMIHDPSKQELRQMSRVLPDDFRNSHSAAEIGIQAADLVAWHYRTLPWEKHWKKHRRRRFINQIAGLKVVGPRLSVDDINNYRSGLYDVLAHENCLKVKSANERALRAEYWKQPAKVAKNQI